MQNPVGIRGIDFIEFTSSTPGHLDALFKAFGFSKLANNSKLESDLYVQNDIKLIVSQHKGSFSTEFEAKHGPCVPAMGWKVDNAEKALAAALDRGAELADRQDFHIDGATLPAIKGIGDSLIYFMEEEASKNKLEKLGFTSLKNPEMVPEKGFVNIDHLTNNVEKGEMERWANFYKDIFGFSEIRYFDIRGAKTGLISYALKSPDGSFCIPINEGTESKSQINEYLREYKGAGVQHIAFTSNDILRSLSMLESTSIETLDIDDEYYDEVFDRVPHVSEDRKEIRKRNVLVDGDEHGYLLQIFTKNIIGPIFIEIIQRKNHFGFGEGNFGALFRSIEKDQEQRGVL